MVEPNGRDESLVLSMDNKDTPQSSSDFWNNVDPFKQVAVKEIQVSLEEEKKRWVKHKPGKAKNDELLMWKCPMCNKVQELNECCSICKHRIDQFAHIDPNRLLVPVQNIPSSDDQQSDGQNQPQKVEKQPVPSSIRKVVDKTLEQESKVPEGAEKWECEVCKKQNYFDIDDYLTAQCQNKNCKEPNGNL